ncbi:MAG TPA: hypothetical protein VEI97_14060, partial [bacterium]|nr:hypothetical protein [bacterium]
MPGRLVTNHFVLVPQPGGALQVSAAIHSQRPQVLLETPDALYLLAAVRSPSIPSNVSPVLRILDPVTLTPRGEHPVDVVSEEIEGWWQLVPLPGGGVAGIVAEADYWRPTWGFHYDPTTQTIGAPFQMPPEYRIETPVRAGADAALRTRLGFGIPGTPVAIDPRTGTWSEVEDGGEIPKGAWCVGFQALSKGGGDLYLDRPGELLALAIPPVALVQRVTVAPPPVLRTSVPGVGHGFALAVAARKDLWRAIDR